MLMISLLINEHGKALTAGMLRGKFDSAREAARIEKTVFSFGI